MLIWDDLFVLKNNGTIREPKHLQGGKERHLPRCTFSRAVTGCTGNWGCVSLRPLQAAQESML